MPSEVVSLLGVRHPVLHNSKATEDAFRTLPTVLRALDKEITSHKKPAVGLEIRPEELGLYIKLIQDHSLHQVPQFKAVLSHPFHQFWMEIISHAIQQAAAQKKAIKFVGLDSGHARKYMFKKIPTNEEQKIMDEDKTVSAQKLRDYFEDKTYAHFARDPVRETIGVRRIRENGVNIAIPGTGHIEGYRLGLPSTRVVYRYTYTKSKRKLDNEIRREYRYAINKMRRGLPTQKILGSKAPRRKSK